MCSDSRSAPARTIRGFGPTSIFTLAFVWYVESREGTATGVIVLVPITPVSVAASVPRFCPLSSVLPVGESAVLVSRPAKTPGCSSAARGDPLKPQTSSRTQSPDSSMPSLMLAVAVASVWGR